MVLSVLQGKGSLRNRRYVGGRKIWPLVSWIERPQTEGGGGINNYQRRGGQDAAAKSGARILYLTGDMTVGRSEVRTSEGGEGECKGGTKGVAQFSVHAAGGKTEMGASGRRKHRGVTGIRQGQGGLVSTSVMVRPSEGNTAPPDQGWTGTSVGGEYGALQM